MTKLQTELKKRDAFESTAQEAALSIFRTSDLLGNRIARLLRKHKLTAAQYNVLRILRGEGKPLPTLEVAQRMIQVAPAITRLVDNLAGRGLIAKKRCKEDGRVFRLMLTASGRRLIAKIDEPIVDLHERLMEGVPVAERRQLIKTLENSRQAIDLQSQRDP